MARISRKTAHHATRPHRRARRAPARAHPHPRRRDGHDDPALPARRGRTFAASASATIAHDLKGNNDLLALTQPRVIREIHDAYLAAGADIIETNTFNSTSIAQADYGMRGARARAQPRGGAHRARVRRRAGRARTPDKPRFVAGALGPTNRTASISPDVNDPGRAQRHASTSSSPPTARRSTGLVEGGADLLLVETIFDTLNAKAALFAIEPYFERARRAACRSWSPARSPTRRAARCRARRPRRSGTRCATRGRSPSGFNCALGAELMRPVHRGARARRRHLRLVLSERRAAEPDVANGYDETPEQTARAARASSRRAASSTSSAAAAARRPTHIRAIARRGRGVPPRARPGAATDAARPRRGCASPASSRSTSATTRCSSTSASAPTSPARARSRKLILAGDYAGALSRSRASRSRTARRSSTSTWTRRCSTRKAAMVRFLNLIAAEPDIARVPVMIDSSKWEVIEAGLKCVQGKPIVNSISHEGRRGRVPAPGEARAPLRRGGRRDGVRREGPGRHASSARSRSASAATTSSSTSVGFPPEDIIFDPNIFAIATGIEEHNNYAVDFIEATRWIREHLPHAKVSGGVSNVSLLASAATTRCARRSTPCSCITRSTPA